MTDHIVQRPHLTLAGAQAALSAALGHAGVLEVAVVIIVTDLAGNLLTSARMDGAPLLSVDVARKKAWTVCAFGGRPTDQWWRMVENDPALLHGLAPKVDDLLPVGGGAPVIIGGMLAGAVGVSGATSAQDQEIADAAAGAVDSGI